MPLDPTKTVLLVCDVQEAFRNAIFGFDAMCKSISKMVKVAKLLEIPMIVTEQAPKALGSTVPELGIQGSPNLVGIWPKTKFSMTTDEVLEGLKSVGVPSNIVLVGIESHICVLQTALDLHKTFSESNILVLADAISSCNRQEVPIALDRIRKFASVSTTESVIYQLLGDAKHPQFKAVSALIKEEKPTTASTLSTLLN